MTKSTLCLPIFALLFLAACKPSVKPEDLYGKWKYIKLEKPNGNPPSATPDWELKIEHPYIEFSKNNDLTLWWADTVLSHGKFTTDGDKIQFRETLPGGQTREFPFYVTELTGNQIVFETRDESVSRVTAVKQ